MEAGEYLHPCSVSELQQIVKHAAESGKQIRVVGSGHAWARLINDKTIPQQAKQIVVRLDRMPEKVRISADGTRATIATGMYLTKVTRLLARKGFVLSSPPVYTGMSIGGLLGTASHGTGYGATETMSDHVVGFKMVDASGEIVEVKAKAASARTPDETALLRAARCSLGLVGIIYEVDLEIYENFFVREDDTLQPLDQVLDGLDAMIEGNEYVELFQVPLTEPMWVKRYNSHPREWISPLKRIFRAVKSAGMNAFQATGYPLVLWSLRHFPNFTPPFNRFISSLLPRGTEIIGVNDAFHFQKVIPKIVATEWVVPRDQIPEMWRLFNAKIQEWRMRGAFPCNVMIEARFINRSSDWNGAAWEPSMFLSPAMFEETGYLEMVSYGPEWLWRDFFADVEESVIDCFPLAVPHWGKWFSRTDYIRDRFHEAVKARALKNAPALPAGDDGLAPLQPAAVVGSTHSHDPFAEFDAVRKKYDPAGMLSNDFLEAIFNRSSAPG